MKSLSLSILFIGMLGYSFKITDPKKEYVQKIQNSYKRLYDKANMADKDAISYLNYEVTIWPNVKASTPQRTNVEIVTGKQKQAIMSDQIETYRDEEVTVNILAHNKTIYINQSIKKNEKKALDDLNQHMLIHDTLFQYCEVDHYEEEHKKNGEVIQKITFKVSEAGIKKLHIVRIMFCFDKTQDLMKEITYQYDVKSNLKKMTLKIIDYRFNYKTAILDKPALDMVFDKNGLLLSKYRNYKLVDNRNKKELTMAQKKTATNAIHKFIAIQKK